MAGFEAQVKAPSELVLGPLPEEGISGKRYVIDRDAPYEVSWAAEADATVEVLISSRAVSPKNTATITCRFPGNTSPRAVPTSLLGELYFGEVTGSLSVSAVRQASVALTDTDVDVRLAFATRPATARIAGFGHPGPTASAVCEAAAAKTAAQCPGTPVSAASCAICSDA